MGRLFLIMRLLFAAFPILLFTGIALPCECQEITSPAAAFEQSDAVFSGEATIVEAFGMEIFAFIKVEKAWKGAVKEEVLVRTDSGSCGVDFERYKTYVLFVDRVGEHFVTQPCRDPGIRTAEFLSQLPEVEISGEVASDPDTQRNRREPEKAARTDLALVFAVAVTGIVLAVMIVIVAFFFWRNRAK